MDIHYKLLKFADKHLKYNNMEDKYRLPYMNAMVRAFGQHFRLSLQQSFKYLYNFHGIHYLDEFYDVERNSPVDETIKDLIFICKRNGGELE